MEGWKDPNVFFIGIVITICILSVLVGFIILITKTYINRVRQEIEEKSKLDISYRQALIHSNIQIQERERERIASDLHDDLIGQLYRIKLMNEDENLNKLLAESISTARNISHDLIPPLLEECSLMELLNDFILPFKKKYVISLFSSTLYQFNLVKNEKLHIFRIFQELMNNIIKHAEATKIDVLLRNSSASLCLIVKDNGIGINKNTSLGLGMKNIELRVQLLGAIHRIKLNKPQGTTFIFLLKKNENAENYLPQLNR